MKMTHFLCALRNLFEAPAKPNKRRSFRPSFEVFEDRLAPATITVTTNGDGVGSHTGSGSTYTATTLRNAINLANTLGGLDTINFAIPGSGVQTINTTGLPNITGPVTIDGTTQPSPPPTPSGYLTAIPAIEIHGTGGALVGLWVKPGAAGSTISSLTINGFASFAIYLQANGNTVQGSFVGTDPTGLAAKGGTNNAGAGILIAGGVAQNLIGKAGNLGSGNVISGNQGSGITISGVGTSNNLVRGNYIGVNATGNGAVPNGNLTFPLTPGVLINSGATNNFISGGPGLANVISGNINAGILITGAGTSNNKVTDNYIGVDAGGTFSVANGTSGVVIQARATSNQIGKGNTISGNNQNGVLITGTGTSLNTVADNSIGLDPTRNAPIQNLLSGVRIEANANNNTIGGNNTISGNHSVGVYIDHASGNTVKGNKIGTDGAGGFSIPNGGGIILAHGATMNIIGGTTVGARNIISGNVAYGVYIYHHGTTANNVVGNYIGTDLAGNIALGSQKNGVVINNGPDGNVIGGPTANEGNLISGHVQSGVNIAGAGTTGNVVRSNIIGLNKQLTAALPNAVGVWIEGGATGTVVGNASDMTGPNTISGNSVFGVAIVGAGTNTNSVAGNFIGTDPTGTAAFPNTFDGVYVGSGASSNIIGGILSGASPSFFRNVISGNGRDGVRIEGAGTMNNFLAANYIGLQADGTTPLGNGGNGVRIDLGASSNSVGSANNVKARNYIAANVDNGVLMADPGTASNHVDGNAIGTDKTLNLALGNNVGIQIAAGAANNAIGSALGIPNIIGSNASAGVRITDSLTKFNKVKNNIIGLKFDGSAARSNTVGVELANGANSNLIGGLSVADRNIISGNTSNYAGTFPGYGVWVHGPSTLRNTVVGNFIGTGLAGNETALGNGVGVRVSNVGSVANISDANYIGGVAVGSRNIISGNFDAGIRVNASGITPLAPVNGIAGLVIQQNTIGANVTGNAALPNMDGVVVEDDSVNVLLGGTAPSAGNIISGNTRYGALINGNGTASFNTSGVVVQGDLIGTKADGVNPLGNGSHGIFITGSTANHNTIGGMLEVAPNAGNVIAFNLGNGIRIGADNSTNFLQNAGNGNTVLGNRIFANAAIGIDLGADNAPTANDPGDNDTGPGANNLQNSPDLTLAMVGFNSIILSGNLNSDPLLTGTTYRMEFFAGHTAGDAEIFLGCLFVTLGPNNTVSFAGSRNFPWATFSGRKIVATATNLDTMDTSEFSAAITGF